LPKRLITFGKAIVMGHCAGLKCRSDETALRPAHT
jgi:hypothetical protein